MTRPQPPAHDDDVQRKTKADDGVACKGKAARKRERCDVADLVRALRKNVVHGTVLPATRLAMGQQVRIGVMTFSGWVPRMQYAETEAQRDQAEEVEFMTSWAVPGQIHWLAIGQAGWTQEIQT